MSLTKNEAIVFFNYIEKLSNHDNKITKSDLEKAVAVDTDGDGKITDIIQSRILPNGNITTWTETEIVNKNVEQWIKCSTDKWTNDEAIDIIEFLELLNIK
jgi:hypothetical protein